MLAVGVVGALLARFRPIGMALALAATALAQAVVALIAIVGELGLPSTGTAELVGLNGLFIALYLASAWLFRSSGAAGQPPDAAGQPRGSPPSRERPRQA